MSAIWPTGVAGDGDLFVAKNNLSTTLNGAVDAVTTTIVLTSAAAFPASGYVTIGTEAIKYTGIAVNTLTGVTRGADGTVAASHLNGTAVNHYAVAAHHNAPKDEIIAIETQLAAEMAATKEPTGFPDASTTTISVVDGTRTFTIAPTGASFDVYVAGKKYTKTSESVVFADTEGVWHFYYDASGVLTASQTAWDLALAAPVSFLYWNATDNVSLDLADERHGSAMDWATHQYLHTTVGTRFVDGLAASGYVLNSAVNADVRFAFSAGHISDEDLRIAITAQTEPAQIPVFYRSGASGDWKRATATDYPYLTTGTGRIAYNLDTAGTWSQAEVSNTDFCAYWIFATNGKNFPIISIQGQRLDTSLANAQNNNLYESLSFGTLPYAEMKLLYRVIVQTNNGYGSTMKVRVVDVQDLRSVSNLPSGSYVATDHGSLSGRTAAGSHPASAISNTPAGTIAATDVQAAIDELDTEKQAALGYTPINKAGDNTIGALGLNTASIDTGAQLQINGTSNPVTRTVRSTSETVTTRTALSVKHLSSAVIADGFGPLVQFDIEGSGSGSNSVSTIGAIRDGADNKGALVFSTSSPASTEKMRITSSGQVGIGVTPSATLHVDDAGGGIIRVSRLGTGANIVQIEADGTNGNLRSDGDLTLSAGSTEKARITSAGLFGVGGTPASNLDVVSTGVVTSTVRTTSTGGSRGAIVRLNEANTGGNAGAGQLLFTYDTDYKQAAAIKATLTAGGAAGVLKLYTGTTERLTIDSTGLLTVPGVYANTDASAANVYVDSSGNLKRSTATPGGSGTVTSATGGQLAYYATTGTTVRGTTQYGTLAWSDAAGLSAVRVDSATDKVSSLTLNVPYSAGGGSSQALTQYVSGNTTYWSVGQLVTGNLFVIANSGALNTSQIITATTGGQVNVNTAGVVGTPTLVLNGDTDTGIWAPAADEWALSTGGTLNLHAKLTSGAPRLGIGVAPSYSLDIKQSLSGNDVDFNLENTNASANGVHMFMTSAAGYCKKQMKTVGTGDVHINFVSANSTTKQFTMGIDYSDTKAFVISRSGTLGTTNVLKFVESNGYASMQGVYDQTTASAANVYVNSSGDLMRSTSSLRYKTAIKDVALEEATKLLDATPVTYASLCEGDNKEERHYGFIAEELDLIDPTLVNYKTLEDGTKVPDGVQYERVVVGLLKLVQDLTKRVVDLEAKQA